MDVRCERCKTEYEVDDASVSDLGTEVQCSDCGHLFVVKRPVATTSQASTGRDSPDAGEWVIETMTGQTHHLRDLTTLHKLIIERRVTRNDRILRKGEPWRRLGDTPELMPFFDIVDSAERARTAAMVPPPLAPLSVMKPPAAIATMPQTPLLKRSSHKPLSAPRRRPVPAVFMASGPSLGAIPTPADHGQTEIIPITPAKRHGVLKLLLTTLVAAVVAYAGILAQQSCSRSAAMSASGSNGSPAESQPAVVRVPPALPSDSEAADAESDSAPAHGPVVEPIAEVDPIHLLGKVHKKTSPAKPVVARKARAELSGRTPAAGATAASAPAASLAAQGYVALNHHKHTKAIALFKQALVGSPSNGTALFGLAEAYRGSGQTSLALQSYRRYVQILPFGPDAGSARFQIRTLEGKQR